MITAGSVRGNCALPHAGAHQLVARRRATPARRRSAGRTGWRSATPPARSRGTPAAPRSARRRRGAAASPRSPTHSALSPGASAGVDHHGEPGRAVLLAEQHPQSRRARPPAATHSQRGRRPDGSGSPDDHQHPARGVGPPLRQPGLVDAALRRPGRAAFAASSRCGKVTMPEASPRLAPVPDGVAPRRSRHEHPHRRPARRDRARRPDARRPAAGEVDRGDLPRRRAAATARCAGCSASPAPGAASAVSVQGSGHGPAVDGDLRQRAAPRVRRRSRSSGSARAAR